MLNFDNSVLTTIVPAVSWNIVVSPGSSRSAPLDGATPPDRDRRLSLETKDFCLTLEENVANRGL